MALKVLRASSATLVFGLVCIVGTAPANARFLQTDPVGYEDSVNLYSYVGNDPINGIDPTGETCIFISGSNGGGSACQRALYYQRIASDPAISSRTSFFSAASAVVNTLASADLRGAGISNSTRAFLANTGSLLAAHNVLRAAQISTGRLYGGSSSIAQNDRDFVRFEQGKMQGYLDGLRQSDSGTYNNVVGEINGVLNGSLSESIGGMFGLTDRNVRSAIDGVRQNLGRDVDFGNYDDRVAIGDALTAAARDNATLCTGSRIRTC